MKRVVYLALLPVAVGLLLVCLAGLSQHDARAVAAPPLSLEGYLDEKLPEASGDEPKLKVDNGSCYVCHGNYDEESLVVTHGKEEVGCIDCHGKSLEHRDDEDNITPPDVMYAPKDVDKKCRECHEEHDAPAEKVVRAWQERCPQKTDPKQIVCTDCHFEHRLHFRTVWWDKQTGELIVRKEGQRVKQAEDSTDVEPKQQ